MAEAEAKKSYPYISASAWGELMRRLRSSIPKKIDREYLHMILGISEKAAGNIVPQLRTIGLIDDDCAPTELVHDLRDSEKYPDACATIVSRVYPDALTDVVTDPANQIDDAVRWFMRQGAGEASAKIQARFFAMMHESSPPDSTPLKKEKAPSTTRAPKNTASKKAETNPDSESASNKASDPNPSLSPAINHTNGANPSLHIDLQIHIASDASVEQIDAVFASMAKHIYGR